MKKNNLYRNDRSLVFLKKLRKYRRLYLKTLALHDVRQFNKAVQELLRIRKKLIRMNRAWRLGISSSVLVAILAFPVQAQQIDPLTIDGTNGFMIAGKNVQDYSGFTVGSAGDINGDGFDDILIGADWADPAGVDKAGEAYVVFGKESGFPAEQELASLDGTNGFTISGTNQNGRLGRSVGGGGDINGDGIDDLVVGAHYAGKAYVIFGASTPFPEVVDPSALDGSDGFRIEGGSSDWFGYAVSVDGDINGDGIDDLVVTAPAADVGAYSLNVGKTYVIFGQENFSELFSISSLDGTNGFSIEGKPYSLGTGTSMSSGGDFNGDGFNDIVLGSHQASPGFEFNRINAGETYVVFGKESGFSANMNLSSLDGQNGFFLSGYGRNSYSGISVDGSADLNGDGFDDLVIGAFKADPPAKTNAGAAYVVFGNNTNTADSLDLLKLSAPEGFKIHGRHGWDSMGRSLGSAGDFNGDGFDDIIIGSYTAQRDNMYYTGETVVLFGKASSAIPDTVDLADMAAGDGIIVTGYEAMIRLGFRVSGAGDINNDGFSDVVIGIPYSDAGEINDAGNSLVVFGSPDMATSLHTPEAPEISVFPNPVSDKIFIDTKKEEIRSLRVFSVSGEEVVVNTADLDRGYINVEHLPAGVYQFMVGLEKGTRSGRFIKH